MAGRRGEAWNAEDMATLRRMAGQGASLTAIARQLERTREAVYSRGVQIGYLSADKTAIVHRAAADARLPTAIFQEATSWGCYIRVAFGELLPQLPPPRDRPPETAPPVPSDDWDAVDWIPPDE